uniref:Sushi domain-containing protein n=1 Tax=Xiphophorus maculatus TaxID=8083 RepID=A0A3B5QT18_XIPMA
VIFCSDIFFLNSLIFCFFKVPAASACVLDMRRLNIDETSQINIKDGETKKIDCTQWQGYSIGWWGTSTCFNGLWFGIPVCISKCFLYPLKRFSSNTTLVRFLIFLCFFEMETGTFDILLKRLMCLIFFFTVYPPTCHEPPRISNAAIINQDFQDVFTQDTEVVYQCKDGYTTKEGATKKSVFCRAGVWTDVPTCGRWRTFRHIQNLASAASCIHLLTILMRTGCLLTQGTYLGVILTKMWSDLPRGAGLWRCMHLWH